LAAKSTSKNCAKGTTDPQAPPGQRQNEKKGQYKPLFVGTKETLRDVAEIKEKRQKAAVDLAGCPAGCQAR
jgi:hypothetical protein